MADNLKHKERGYYMSNQSHDQKAMLWCLGTLEEFANLGLVEQSPFIGMSVKGISAWDELDAQFAPSDADIGGILSFVRVADASMDGFFTLMRRFRDHREDLLEGIKKLKGG